MQYFSLVLMLMALSSLANAADPTVDEILKRSSEVLHGEKTEAKDVIKGTQRAEVLEDVDWLKGSNKDRKTATPSKQQTDTAQQRAWNQITGAVDSQPKAEQGPPRPKVPDNVMYVYISLSMPEETIKALFLQALGLKKDYSVIFLLRGWEPPGPNALVARLNALFPEKESLRELPNVQINPVLFTEQAVQEVPTFTTKSKKGEWVSVIGSTSILDAISRVEGSKYLGEVIGPTFEIEEPNILELIQERITKFDWTDQVNKAKSRALTRKTTGSQLPTVEKDESYLVDLTIVNNGDLKGSTGEVFSKQGDSVNPFDYLSTQRRYVFFDGNDPNQLKQAIAWRSEHDYVTLITTLPFSTIESRKEAIGALGQPVHEINQLLIKRFRLKAVPSIAYQEGRMLRVEIVGRKSMMTTQFGAR